MDRDPVYARVLTVFATYGFRKASMADLAEAAGVSRQTLYNRFADKQAVLAWAVGGWAGEVEAAAMAALAADRPVEDRLVAFFVEWLGTSVPIVRGLPHGAEIFDMARASLPSGSDETQMPAWRALAAFLQDQGLAAAGAEDGAYVLILASKGLMLKVGDVDAYAAGMRRVVRFVLDGAQTGRVIAAK